MSDRVDQKYYGALFAIPAWIECGGNAIGAMIYSGRTSNINSIYSTLTETIQHSTKSIHLMQDGYFGAFQIFLCYAVLSQ